MTGVVLRGLRVLDPNDGVVTRSRDVFIEKGMISMISSSSIDVADLDVTVYRCDDLLLMPGLIDAHVHVTAVTADLRQLASVPRSLVFAHAQHALGRMLDRGFTTVRDAGGADWGLGEALRRGYFQGPRLLVSGQALAQTGGQGDFRLPGEDILGCVTCGRSGSIATVVDGVEGVRRAAREQLRRGADQLKVMAGGGMAGRVPVDRSHFSVLEIEAAVEEATAAKTYVMAHAYSPHAIRRAVDAGVRTIEHGNCIDNETASRLVGRAYMVPTLSIYNSYCNHANELNLSDEGGDRAKRLLDKGMEAIGLCHTSGVELGFGTDLEGFLQRDQLDEFCLRGEVESSLDTIRSATSVNAEMLGFGGTLGTVRERAVADLLVVEGNPLDNLGILLQEGRAIRAIMQEGQFVKNELLEESG